MCHVALKTIKIDLKPDKKMAKSSVTISIPQMIDLALNGPEAGTINLNILHTLLHVVVRQLNLLNTTVEFRGDDSDRVHSLVVNQNKHLEPMFSFNTYTVGKKSATKDVEVTPLDPAIAQTVVVVNNVNAGELYVPHLSIAVEKEDYDNLKESIHLLQEEITELKTMPVNSGLMDALRNLETDRSNPILDMFRSLTLSKRIDGIEMGLAKLGNMIKELVDISDERNRNILLIPDQAMNEEQVTEMSIIERSQPMSIPPAASMHETQTHYHQLFTKVKLLETAIFGEAYSEPSQCESSTTMPFKSVCEDVKPYSLRNTIEEHSELISKLHIYLYGCTPNETPPENPICIDTRLRDFEEYMKSLDFAIQNQKATVIDSVLNLEEDVAQLKEHFNTGGGRNEIIDQAEIFEIQATINTLDSTLAEQATYVSKILDDQFEASLVLQAIQNQMDALESSKANRTEMEDALLDKADTCIINDKLSIDQFEFFCMEIHENIKDLLCEFKNQMETLNISIKTVQENLNTKINPDDLVTLQNFMMKKLKMLQERIKASKQKEEKEAAGAISEVLKDLNCLSCKEKVNMQKTSLPPITTPQEFKSKSHAPNLAFEMDLVRHQQKRSQEVLQRRSLSEAPKLPHVVNRYCGGSHTITTPFQRATVCRTFQTADTKMHANQKSTTKYDNYVKTSQIAAEDINKTYSSKNPLPLPPPRKNTWSFQRTSITGPNMSTRNSNNMNNMIELLQNQEQFKSTDSAFNNELAEDLALAAIEATNNSVQGLQT